MIYTILKEKNTEALSQSVSRAIKHGWQPIGGLCVYRRNNKTKYAQALFSENNLNKELKGNLLEKS